MTQSFLIWDSGPNSIPDIAILKEVINERYGRFKSLEELSVEYVTNDQPKDFSFERGQYYKFYLN